MARVSAVRDVVVARALEPVLAVVRDIELLEPLERKARHVEVHPSGPDDGWYRITGRLARLVPWTGDFSYHQHAAGWHSEALGERDDGWRISGGFLVSRVDDEHTRVVHYEDYGLPPRLARWRLLFVAYMRRSQVGEMRDLVELLEKAIPAGVESVPATA